MKRKIMLSAIIAAFLIIIPKNIEASDGSPAKTLSGRILLQAQAKQGASQYREQALEQVAEQGQTGQAFAGASQGRGLVC